MSCQRLSFLIGRNRVLTAAILLLWLTAGSVEAQTVETQGSSTLKTRNVLLITVDGLRWQEVFGGADATLMDKDAGGHERLQFLVPWLH